MTTLWQARLRSCLRKKVADPLYLFYVLFGMNHLQKQVDMSQMLHVVFAGLTFEFQNMKPAFLEMTPFNHSSRVLLALLNAFATQPVYQPCCRFLGGSVFRGEQLSVRNDHLLFSRDRLFCE